MRRALLLVVLAACGDNIRATSSPSGDAGGDADPTIGDATSDAAMPDAHVNLACETPEPPVARQLTLDVAIPSDFDPTANPTPTTQLAFTVLLPERCPGDAFPLILHSHGWGGERIAALAPDGTLHPEQAHFGSINTLVAALPYHGYVVLSFDERGHHDSGGNARIIDPQAETADARALLDWAYDHAVELAIQREATTTAKDVRVATIGYSYGGGFQLPLAILDARIDAIVPNGTWHELLYSLMPGDAVKLSYDGLLCLLAATGNVAMTPLVASMCNTVGITSATAANVRSRGDLPQASALATFFDGHAVGTYARSGIYPPHPVPALFLQGNRDVLFNLTEAVWNARYFAATGADVRLLSTEGGHMNPLANQVEGTANCGATKGVAAILQWLDFQLKGQGAIDAIPRTCLSLDAGHGVTLAQVPVGAQTGTGAVPATLATATANVPLATINPVFVPVATISGANRVLAGVPTMKSIAVTAGTGAVQSTNAFVGVAIRRGATTILVDDQVTAFAAGTHATNRNVGEDDRIWLPAVAEPLQDGDVVGLAFYPSHVQYAAIVSAQSFPGAPGVINYVGGTQVPPFTSSLNPVTGLTYVNPYRAVVTDVQLPIIVPGTFTGSARW